jgi:hypothetical protein
MARKALAELKKEYGLLEEDFWRLPQNKKVQVISHDGCKKIASQENIEFFDINWINMGERVGKYEFVYSLELYAKKAESDIRVHATGEANSENCKIAYPVAIAEKRAKDRAILLLVGFSELGIHSDVEGEIAESEKEFDNPEDGTQVKGKSDDDSGNESSITKLRSELKKKRESLKWSSQKIMELASDEFKVSNWKNLTTDHLKWLITQCDIALKAKDEEVSL